MLPSFASHRSAGVGRTPELAALSLFVASTLTEISQYYWPRGLFPGRFDAWDIFAYAFGLAVCCLADTQLSQRLAPTRAV